MAKFGLTGGSGPPNKAMEPTGARGGPAARLGPAPRAARGTRPRLIAKSFGGRARAWLGAAVHAMTQQADAGGVYVATETEVA